MKKFVHFIGTFTLYLDFRSLSYLAPYLYKQSKRLRIKPKLEKTLNLTVTVLRVDPSRKTLICGAGYDPET